MRRLAAGEEACALRGNHRVCNCPYPFLYASTPLLPPPCVLLLVFFPSEMRLHVKCVFALDAAKTLPISTPPPSPTCVVASIGLCPTGCILLTCVLALPYLCPPPRFVLLPVLLIHVALQLMCLLGVLVYVHFVLNAENSYPPKSIFRGLRY